jgi:EF-P beta-lysylation protein EpmB
MSAIVTPIRNSVGAGSRASAPWRDAVRTAIRDPGELCRRLGLPADLADKALLASRQFPLFVPLPFVERIRPGDPNDPLLRQILPLADELFDPPGFEQDAVGDGAAKIMPGLVQKYEGRALLVMTGACPVHCRYCFRRHYPYFESPRSLEEWRPVIDHLARDPSLDEVILSGGDPLMLTDARLAELVGALADVPHLRRLRIHTRLPIMIPARVCDDLLAWLRTTRWTPIVVVHANHPEEIGLDASDPVSAALAKLIDAGIPVLNQAVLLKGVNDDARVLAELCRRLVNLRVMPYYLHQLDRVRGAAHFEVPVDRARAIVSDLRAMLPGYAVPRYVLETPGAASKTPLG